MNNRSPQIPRAKSASKLFFSGMLILTVSNVIVKTIGLLFKIPMNHVVGDTGMGYYTSAYTIYTLLYMISTAGLPVALSKMISESRAQGRIKLAKRIYTLSLILFAVVGFVSMSVMALTAKWYSSVIIGASPTYVCIYAIAPTLLFVCITSAFRGYFQGYQQMLPTAVSQVIESACKLGIGIAAALYAIGKGYEIHVVAAFASVGLTVGVILGTLFLAGYKLFFREEPYNREYVAVTGESELIEKDSYIIKRLVRIAIPITLSASVMSLSNIIDAVLVQRMLQDIGMSQEAATTVYGNYTTLAVPLFNLPAVLVNPVGCSIIPLISALNERGETKRASVITESALRVAVLIGLPCATGLTVLAGPILRLLYVEASADMATPLLMLLAPSSLFVCIITVTNAMLQANGHETKPLISMLIGGAAKIVTNYLLIGKIGMAATPISTLVCYVFAAVMNFVFVYTDIGIRINFAKVFWRPLAADAVCGGVAYLSYMLLSTKLGDKVSAVGAIGLAVVAYFASVLLFGAITKDDADLLPGGGKIVNMLKKSSTEIK